MSEIKHVGRIIATGKKCVVAYRTLPGDSGNCLIVPTENLPDSYHDALINLVESNVGQSSYEFAEAMARTGFPDGTIMLTTLHTRGGLIRMATDQIEMLPRPAVTILLSELNQMIADQRGLAIDDLSLKSNDIPNPKTPTGPALSKQDDVGKTTSSSVNAEIVELSAEQQADAYKLEAELFAKKASDLWALAEQLVPTLVVDPVVEVEKPVVSKAKVTKK
jgi:hypothetical protein